MAELSRQQIHGGGAAEPRAALLSHGNHQRAVRCAIRRAEVIVVEQREYVRRLLEAYRATPGTSGVVRRPGPLFAAQLHNRGVPLENGRERVHTCGSASFGEASRCAPARDHSIHGILLAGDRGSPATEGRPGILSAPPQQTPPDHCRTISPSLSKRQPTTRACGADDIDPTHISAKQRHTPAAWMMTCVQTIILFPHRVTLAEHKWVTFPERRRADRPVDS